MCELVMGRMGNCPSKMSYELLSYSGTMWCTFLTREHIQVFPRYGPAGDPRHEFRAASSFCYSTFCGCTSIFTMLARSQLAQLSVLRLELIPSSSSVDRPYELGEPQQYMIFDIAMN